MRVPFILFIGVCETAMLHNRQSLKNILNGFGSDEFVRWKQAIVVRKRGCLVGVGLGSSTLNSFNISQIKILTLDAAKLQVRSTVSNFGTFHHRSALETTVWDPSASLAPGNVEPRSEHALFLDSEDFGDRLG